MRVIAPSEWPFKATLNLSPTNGLKVSAEMLSKNEELAGVGVPCWANNLGTTAPASIVTVARERKLRRVTDMFWPPAPFRSKGELLRCSCGAELKKREDRAADHTTDRTLQAAKFFAANFFLDSPGCVSEDS
jgi:hypothetical protein